MNTIEGQMTAAGCKFGIVTSRFNGFVTDALLKGAVDALQRHGADSKNITNVYVPGSYELPLTLQAMAASKKYDALIGLAAVIRGDTPHFDFVANEASKGLAQVMLEHNIPISFGVITVNTVEQAIERAGTKNSNKGYEAATTAIEMVNVLKQL